MPSKTKIIKAIDHCLKGGDCKYCTYGTRCEMVEDRVADCHKLLEDVAILLKKGEKD